MTPADGNHPALTARTVDPLAALLDAQTDAHHAGVCQADVELLEAIGDAIAKCAADVAEKCARMSDGRMVTRWAGGIQTRKAETFAVADIAENMAESAFSLLDAYPVIVTTLRLALSPARARAA